MRLPTLMLAKSWREPARLPRLERDCLDLGRCCVQRLRRMVKKPEHSFVAGVARQSSSNLRLACGVLHHAYSTLVEGRTGGGRKAYGLEDIARIHYRNRRSGAAGAQRVSGHGES